MTLKECLISYVQAKKSYLKESTYVRYSNLIRNHLDENSGEIQIDKLTNKNIQEYCDTLLNNKVSPTVVNEVVLLIKLSLKRDAKINSYQPLFIDLDLPVIIKKRKISILSRNDQKTIMNYILANGSQKYCGILLSLMTGLRIGELCALKWSDIDLKKRIIIVDKTLQRICKKGEKSKITITVPKTSNSNREIPISNALFNGFNLIKKS